MEEEFEYNPGYPEERNYGRIYPGFDCRRRRRPGALHLRRGRYIPEALTPDKANGRALPAIAVAARATPRARRLAQKTLPRAAGLRRIALLTFVLYRECPHNADSSDATAPGYDCRIQQRPVPDHDDHAHHAGQLARDGADQAAQREDGIANREPVPVGRSRRTGNPEPKQDAVPLSGRRRFPFHEPRELRANHDSQGTHRGRGGISDAEPRSRSRVL